MSLRLAGEEFSIVQGLDALGWPREVKVTGDIYDPRGGVRQTIPPNARYWEQGDLS